MNTPGRTRLFASSLAAVTLVAGCADFKSPWSKADTPDAQPRQTSAAPANKPAEEGPPPKINASTHFAAGRLHEREGNYYAAIEQYQRAVQADPTYVLAYNRLGIVYDRLKAYERANEAFLKAIDLAPQMAFLRNNLAFSHMLEGDYVRAEAALRAALGIKADYHRARVNLGVVLTRTDRIDQAVEEFAKALPRDAAFFNVGLLCMADQKYDEARRAFQQALSINPSFADAQKQLDRVSQLAASRDSLPPPPTRDVSIAAALAAASQPAAAAPGDAQPAVVHPADPQPADPQTASAMHELFDPVP